MCCVLMLSTVQGLMLYVLYANVKRSAGFNAVCVVC